MSKIKKQPFVIFYRNGVKHVRYLMCSHYEYGCFLDVGGCCCGCHWDYKIAISCYMGDKQCWLI